MYLVYCSFCCFCYYCYWAYHLSCLPFNQADLGCDISDFRQVWTRGGGVKANVADFVQQVLQLLLLLLLQLLILLLPQRYYYYYYY